MQRGQGVNGEAGQREEGTSQEAKRQAKRLVGRSAVANSGGRDRRPALRYAMAGRTERAEVIIVDRGGEKRTTDGDGWGK